MEDTTTNRSCWVGFGSPARRPRATPKGSAPISLRRPDAPIRKRASKTTKIQKPQLGFQPFFCAGAAGAAAGCGADAAAGAAGVGGAEDPEFLPRAAAAKFKAAAARARGSVAGVGGVAVGGWAEG